MLETLPDNAKTLFQEVKIDSLDLKKHRDFIVSRIIEDGTFGDVKWLRENYSDEDITEVVKKARNISRSTASYWQLILNIEGPILCLQKEFQSQRERHWRN